jgi:hypothetical protein
LSQETEEKEDDKRKSLGASGIKNTMSKDMGDKLLSL